MIKVGHPVRLAVRSIATVGGPPRLRLRGLPFHTSEEQLLAFFQGFRLAPGSPRGRPAELLRGLGRRPTGQAFAYFADAAEAMRARDELHGRPFAAVGGRIYRAELLEDFEGRAIVTDEDSPGDIEEEALRDKVRRTMVGAKWKEKENQKKVLYRQY
uniref:RRM domain-containing protein n=1 Tax=Alexandrium catenella TaxID=2925 RepID=A0A7S1RFB8_ALECA|mmetsp:Transcript_55891/g.149634  ORF Transcript_55891/g.149634 Transcript_55891/m.149634 type:complete len:157 (+) Transcript_55891:127-597(+)